MEEGSKEAADRLDWQGPRFSARARRVAHAVIEALLSDEDEHGALIPARASLCEEGVAWLENATGQASADLRRGFGFLTLLMDVLPIVVIGEPSRMVNLSLEKRVRYLEALEASRFGLFAMLLVAFKVPMCIPAFEDPEELAATGFDRPDLVTRRKLPIAAGASV